MPRTTQQIIEHAEELAARFEHMEPTGEPEVTPLGELYLAVKERAEAERQLTAKVKAARKAGLSWPVIGQMLGTSDEAARQRYGRSGTVTSMRAGSARKRPIASQAARRRRSEGVAAGSTKRIAKSTKDIAAKSMKGIAAKSGKGVTRKSTKSAAAKSGGTRGRRSN